MPNLNNTFNLPIPGSPRFESDVAKAISRIRDSLGANSTPSFDSVEFPGLTASRLLSLDADQKLTNTDLISWVTGTANRVTVTDDSDGTITLSGPQDIHTGASPTFAGLTVDGYPGNLLTVQSTGETGNTTINFQCERYLVCNYTVARTTAAAAQFTIRRARNTLASPQSVANTDELGSILFQAHDGTGYLNAAGISSLVVDTPGTNDMPSGLFFFTNPGSSNYRQVGKFDETGLFTTSYGLAVETTNVDLWSGTDSNYTLNFYGYNADQTRVEGGYIEVHDYGSPNNNVVFGANGDYNTNVRLQCDNASGHIGLNIGNTGYSAATVANSGTTTIFNINAPNKQASTDTDDYCSMVMGATDFSITNNKGGAIITSSPFVISASSPILSIKSNSSVAAESGEIQFYSLGVDSGGRIRIVNDEDTNNLRIDVRRVPTDAWTSSLYVFRGTAGQEGRVGIKVAAPQENLHVADTIRADTFFNHNGTDGTSDATAGTPTAITVAGGLVTAITKSMDLSDIADLTPTDGNFIVGNGSAWVVESGSTARTSLGLGTANEPQFLGLGLGVAASPSIKLYVAGQDTQEISVFQGASDTDYIDPGLKFRRSRGTINTPTVVQDGDELGSIIWRGFDGADWETAASIRCAVDGIPADDTTDMPGKLIFSTTVDGSDNSTDWIVLRQNGKCGFGGEASPQEDVHAGDTVRADTFFNHNGTDGLSQTTANPGSVTSSGGIITAMSVNPYGSMYTDNVGHTVTVSAADTMYEVDGDITGGTESGMTFQNSKEIKCLTAGKYLVTYAISLNADSATQKEIESDVMVNGTETGLASAHSETGIGADRPQTNAGTAILTLAADDLVSLGVANHTDTTDIIVEHLSMTLIKVGA